MARIAFFTTLLLLGTAAHADIDRSQYHELPDGGTPTLQVMTVPESHLRYYADRLKCSLATPQTGDYDVYVDRNGIGTNVDVMRSIPGCDAYVAMNLLAGRQQTKPNDAYVHHYTIELRLEAPDKPGAKPKNVPPHMLDAQVIEREIPHLPDAVLSAIGEKHPDGGEITLGYYVTVGTDGHVTAVDPMTPNPAVDPSIIATLKRWRFKPQPIPIRTILRFNFVIPARRWPSRR
jgi:hypothetical protein